jgi:hypothetical protein
VPELIRRTPKAKANTMVVIMLASIPYSAPFRILLSADLISKTAVTAESFPLKFSPRIEYRI